MKFKFTFKTSDVDYYVSQRLGDEFSENEEEIKLVLEKFVKYNELVTIEFDTENNSAKVLEVK